MKDIQLLIKKSDLLGGYNNIYPKTYTDAVVDKGSGKALTNILSGFNCYFLSYNGNIGATRKLVPMSLRREGLWITYVLYDHTVITEWYNSASIDDNSWADSSNWRLGNNILVGDLSISSDGYWVVNGKKLNTKAIGASPLLKMDSNYTLWVSYNNLDWKKIITFPILDIYNKATSAQISASNAENKVISILRLIAEMTTELGVIIPENVVANVSNNKAEINDLKMKLGLLESITYGINDGNGLFYNASTTTFGEASGNYDGIIVELLLGVTYSCTVAIRTFSELPYSGLVAEAITMHSPNTVWIPSQNEKYGFITINKSTFLNAIINSSTKGIKEDIISLNNNINSIDSNIKDLELLNIGTYTKIRGSLGNGSTLIHTKDGLTSSILIKVNSGDNILIIGNAIYNTFYCLLQNPDLSTTIPASFANANNYDGREISFSEGGKGISLGTKEDIIAGSNASYLYIRILAYQADTELVLDTTPIEVLINGIPVYTNTVVEAVNRNKFKASGRKYIEYNGNDLLVNNSSINIITDSEGVVTGANITASSVYSSSTYLRCDAYSLVEAFLSRSVATGYTSGYAFYDKDLNFIDGNYYRDDKVIRGKYIRVIAPADTYYFRISCFNAYRDYFFLRISLKEDEIILPQNKIAIPRFAYKSTIHRNNDEETFILLNNIVLVNTSLYYMYYEAYTKNSSIGVGNLNISDSKRSLRFAYSNNLVDWVFSFPKGIKRDIELLDDPDYINNRLSNSIFLNKHNATCVAKVPDNEYPFRMITDEFVDLDTYTNKTYTVLYKSKDGINFVDRKVLLYEKYDTLYDIVVRGNVMKVFMRMRFPNAHQRAIATMYISIDGAIISPPTILYNKYYYNAAASALDDKRELIMPTYFDNDYPSDNHYDCLIVDGDKVQKVESNIDSALRYRKNIEGWGSDRWGMVSPNILTVYDEGSTHSYIAYSLRNSSHDSTKDNDTDKFLSEIRIAEITWLTYGRSCPASYIKV